jgi:hypothetical protein
MQANSKTLEPFDYQSDNSLKLPSIFMETFVAPNNEGINQIINQFEDISLNYWNYRRETDKLNYGENPDNANTYNRYYNIKKPSEENPYDGDILDIKGNMRYRPRLVDAQKEDGQTMIIQQNSMYIIGMITTATLLITAIMLVR